METVWDQRREFSSNGYGKEKNDGCKDRKC